MRPKDALLSQENKGRFPAFCHGSSIASCGRHSRQLLRPLVFGRRKSNYGEPVPDLAAVTDHENNFVFDLLACLLLLYFGVWHVTMIRTNRTSLEPPNEERYDVGVSANVRQVMGQKRWLWPLPVWLDDGPHAELEWPLAEGEPRHDRD